MHLGVWSVSTDCFTRPALRRRHCLDRYQGLLGVLGSRVLQKEVVEESECTGGGSQAWWPRARKGNGSLELFL